MSTPTDAGGRDGTVLAPCGHRGIKIRNDYLGSLGDLYEKAPKAVLAAVLVSLIIKDTNCIPEDGPIIRDEFCKEWLALYRNGIVPQSPPASYVVTNLDGGAGS